MRVLIAGASGFIGAQVVRSLIRRSCEVHALVRPTADMHRLKNLVGDVNMVYGSL
jgi:uncharacterized protein YbjT (DUF2867 family)